MSRLIPSALVILLVVTPAAPVLAQGFPTISTRQFTEGTAKLIVKGAFSIDADMPINIQASYGDGEVTWIQFGTSGSAEPNALITYGDTKEIGIIVGRGRLIATGGIEPGAPSPCSGKVDVAARLISGRYVCKGISSYDPVTSRMGNVDIDITFTAKS